MSHHFNGGKWLARQTTINQTPEPAVEITTEMNVAAPVRREATPATWRIVDRLTDAELLEWQAWTAQLPKFQPQA